MGREFEVYPAKGGKVVRVLAEDELEAAETASLIIRDAEDYYVYPADLPVGLQGVDPEEPDDGDYQ